MKHDFMLLTSHELKTPLTVLSGTFDLFRRGKFGELSELQHRKFEDMSRSLKRITELGASMYYLSRGYEKMEESWDLCNLSSILNEVAEDAAIIAIEKNQTISCEIPPGMYLTGCEKDLYNLFSKILDNAIRYTRKDGKISVTLTDKGKMLHIIIKDTGIGIPSELCEKIFDEFYEISDVMRHKSGFGLGLSIARKVVHSHGGRIWVKSRVGRGSTFHVMLPRNAGMEYSNEWKLQTGKRMCID